MKRAYDTLTLDPVAMNVVNRVASGSEMDGQLVFEGGLLVQGKLSGRVLVRGRLVIWRGAQVSGRIKVTDDLYLFGHLGEPDGAPDGTTMECEGQVYVSRTGVSSGTLLARRLVLYEGAELRGPFKTLRQGVVLPTLRDVVTDFDD